MATIGGKIYVCGGVYYLAFVFVFATPGAAGLCFRLSHTQIRCLADGAQTSIPYHIFPLAFSFLSVATFRRWWFVPATNAFKLIGNKFQDKKKNMRVTRSESGESNIHYLVIPISALSQNLAEPLRSLTQASVSEATLVFHFPLRYRVIHTHLN